MYLPGQGKVQPLGVLFDRFYQLSPKATLYSFLDLVTMRADSHNLPIPISKNVIFFTISKDFIATITNTVTADVKNKILI